MAVLESCSVGRALKDECHKTIFSKTIDLSDIDSLSAEEVELLSLRSKVNKKELTHICEHHRTIFLLRYENDQKKCYNPFGTHTKSIGTSLRVVSLELYNRMNKVLIPGVKVNAVPGQKFCDNCRKKIMDLIPTVCVEMQDSQSGSSGMEMDSQHTDGSQPHSWEWAPSREKTIEDCNEALEKLGQSPMKIHALAPHNRLSYGKRKYDAACSSLCDMVGNVVGVNIPVLNDIQQKAQNYDELIGLFKSKIPDASRSEIYQLLTLSPTSWSKAKIKEEFKVSDYMVRQALHLRNTKGILAVPDTRQGKKLDEKTKDLIIEFYEKDDNSRLMPGMNDKVSVGRNQYKQKRLVLANLNDLYSTFKFDYPDVKVGFSTFCSLRPKWCVLAGSYGTHSVCVCTIHENVSLLLQACKIGQTHHDLFKYLVCSTTRRDCMLGHCPNCPGPERLREFLIKTFDEQYEQWDLSDEISYNMWISTDRTHQATFTVSFEEFIDTLVTNLQQLVPHSFIAKAQADYLKSLKTNLSESEAIVLMDFSQNYSYIIQNEVQGYHWTHESCTLHPVTIYVRQGDEVKAISLCAISEDLDHDVPFVYATMKYVADYIKKHFPNVKHIHYFTDGCAKQYKNFKTFCNLCHHEEDFDLTAEWNFFATSHGKSPCDGTGGTIKRLLRRASLQKDSEYTINTPEKVFNFCKDKTDTEVWLISKESLMVTREQQADRFVAAQTIPGTRSFHHFKPISISCVQMKRVSSDEIRSVFNFSKEDTDSNAIKMSEVATNSYVAFTYDGKWYFGLVLAKLEEEGDVEVQLMFPHGPATSFHWPQRKEVVRLVPINNFISIVQPPSTTSSGRAYYFSKEEINFADSRFKLHINET